MTDKDAGRTGERVPAPEPWWARLGPWGAVALIVFGGIAAAWLFLRPPGAPEEAAQGCHQAARVVAIGSVVGGCALLGRRRAGAGEANEQERL